MKTVLAGVLALGLGALAYAQDKKPDEKEKPAADPRAEKLAALKKSLSETSADLQKQFSAASDEGKRNELRTLFFKARAEAAAGAVKLAAETPADATGFDAAMWALQMAGDGAAGPAAAKLIAEHHAANPKVKQALPMLAQMPSSRPLLKTLVEKADDKDVKGMATFALGKALAEAADNAGDPKAAAAMTTEAELYLAKAAKEFPEVTFGRGAIGKQAEEELYTIRNLAVGKPAPDVEGTDLDGKKVKLSSYRGKVVVMDIWATWCPPCRAMIPHERELVKKLEGKPFVLLSISADAKKETLTEFLDKEKMPWAHWWDGQRGPVGDAYKVKFFPTIYVLDAKGVIRYKGVRGEKMDQAVEALLKETPGNKSQ